MTRAVVAEFHLTPSRRFELFSLIVRVDDHPGHQLYDVDWCKRDGLYCFHNSGGGFGAPFEVGGIYWASEAGIVAEKPCTLVEKKSRQRNRTRRLKKLPKGYDGDLLEWLQNNGIESDTVYCTTCKDRLPTADTDQPCGHVYWSEEAGWWDGAVSE